mmetsp:Transcript_373/g.1246  ORF Transcript_373/g.1246 Transcript_373/m.1246 type:complete len:252 (-) Transcript_373:841-1596(-)
MAMCFSKVLNSDRPQSKMWTLTASRTCCSGCERGGKQPQSKPSATELPIHFCGVITKRQVRASRAKLRTTWFSTSSASSIGASVDSSLSGPGSAGTWCTSMKCMIISEAGMRWYMIRSAFFRSFAWNLVSSPRTYRSKSGSMEDKVGGAPSKPSSRKPSSQEFVAPSMMLWRRAAMRDLPCHPASAVCWPILMSNIRNSSHWSRRFRMTNKSSWPVPCTSHRWTPAYSNMKRIIPSMPPPVCCLDTCNANS